MFSFLTATFLLVLLEYETAVANKTVLVQIEQGWLEGEQLELVTGDGKYFSFKGIPYAAPPVGKLRFKPPQPHMPWKGIRKATKDGHICVQHINTFSGSADPGKENCLFLNVYSNNINPENLMPVMFFIHGGGFVYGAGTSNTYGPDYLVPHDVVLVTINYRLNVLGFLTTETIDIPGNLGLKDQVAALKWVKRNVKKFGGDPDNITIFGQSAGGASVIYHMISPMSQGLFNRAISMSGVPTCDWALPYQPRRRSFELGKYLGLNTNNATELYEFFLKVPAHILANINPNVLASENITGNAVKMFYFVPTIERYDGNEQFLAENPLTAIKHGNIGQVDLMIGQTNAEGLLFITNLKDPLFDSYRLYPELLVPRKILYRNTPNEILEMSDVILDHYFNNEAITNKTAKQFLRYITDSTFSYDIYRHVKILGKVLKKNMFVYEFSKVSRLNFFNKEATSYNLTGASHLDDLTYLFSGASNVSVKVNTKEYEMVQQVTKLYTNFAKYGNPTPDKSLGVIWPVYNENTKGYLNIGNPLKTGKALNEDVGAFWKTIFDIAGLIFL